MTAQADALLVQVNRAFAELGGVLGLRDLALDENLALSLVFDSHLMIEAQLAGESEALFLLASLSARPPLEGEASVRWHEHMLEAPIKYPELAGGFFAFDSDSEEVLLVRALPAARLDCALLESEIEAFINMLEYWSGQTIKGVLDLTQLKQAPAKGEKSLQGKSAVRV